MTSTKRFPHTWEEAILILREQPEHQQLILDSYLTADLKNNCERFLSSDEFVEVLRLILAYVPNAKSVLDIPAGNGIASYAFAKSGFDVTAIEPDPSDTVGLGAINQVRREGQLESLVLVGAYGESLPLRDETFDIVYIRQGLHHAHDLGKMVSESVRVLRKGGLLIAAREPVVDNYLNGLQEFLDAQPDHQLYGGENAFIHQDYLKALQSEKLELVLDLGPYDSIVNLAPKTFEEIRTMVLNSRRGKLLKMFLPSNVVYRAMLSTLKRNNKEQGRLHTFVAKKI